MIHLKCFRHFQMNSQSNPYRYHIKQSIERYTEFEFNHALNVLPNIFKKAVLSENSQLQKGKWPTVSVKININDIINNVRLMYNYKKYSNKRKRENG